MAFGGTVKFILVLSSLLLVIGCQTSNRVSDKCSSVRAAFDIGSGETKLKVAQVNTCELKIEKVLLESKRDVGYKADLEKSKNKQFSDTIADQGYKALQELKNEAATFKPTQYVGVATAAFRDAENAEAFIEKIEKELAIKVEIISQQEEGILGFYAARTRVDDMKPQASLVWDIGGGSQQMILERVLSGQRHNLVYEGKIASVSFKNHVVKNIQKKSLDTPNPMTKNQVEASLRFAKNTAAQTVGEEFKQAIREGHKIYGIGGVHNYSIKGQVKKDQYNIEDLEKVIKSRIGKTDEHLGAGTYVSTDTTNPILIKAYMQQLGIKSVEVVSVNLADGLLISPQHWLR